MRFIRNILKKIIPESYIQKYRQKTLFNILLDYYYYDANLFFKHSNFFNKNTQNKSIGKIIHTYHVIEKGLTMPEMRLGFGQAKLSVLIDECLNYRKKYDVSNTQYLHALGVIDEYRSVHHQNDFLLNEGLANKIDEVLDKSSYPQIKQKSISKEDYFKYTGSSFDKFSESRKSIRSFKGTAALEDLEKAVDLSQNTPSACNRQPARVHIVQDKDAIHKILSIHNGNRGFGHLVDKLIILTADLSTNQGPEERMCPYVDGGMYAMNLLYALHYHKIAACPLNWCTSPDSDKQLRREFVLPESEVVILLIACGDLPDNFQIALSKRNNYKDITKIH